MVRTFNVSKWGNSDVDQNRLNDHVAFAASYQWLLSPRDSRWNVMTILSECLLQLVISGKSLFVKILAHLLPT